MSNIGLTCDVCGRTVQGITFVNGMKFCAKCYQETFGNNYSQTDIINAQYTEKLLKENTQLNDDIKHYKKEIQKSNVVIANLKNQLKQAKHQLAEKDEEIEELKDLADIWKSKCFEKMETQILAVTKEKEHQIRHQVCQEIRKFCYEYATEENGVMTINTDKDLHTEDNLLDFLDQIEEGE